MQKAFKNGGQEKRKVRTRWRSDHSEDKTGKCGEEKEDKEEKEEEEEMLPFSCHCPCGPDEYISQESLALSEADERTGEMHWWKSRDHLGR